MTRISKQARRRAISPRRPSRPGPKTGPKKDNLEKGFREHTNAVEGDLAQQIYVPPVRSV